MDDDIDRHEVSVPHLTEMDVLEIRRAHSYHMRSPLVLSRADEIRRAGKSQKAGKEFTLRRTITTAIADRSILVALLLDSAVYGNKEGLQPVLVPPGVPEDMRSVLLGGLSVLAYKSKIFFWMKRVENAAHAMLVPDHVFGAEGWPYSLMWWAFEDPPVIASSKRGGYNLHVQAILLSQEEEQVAIHLVGVDSDSRVLIESPCLVYGDRLRRADQATVSSEVLKMIAFLNSKYIDHSSQRMCRTDRKLLIHADMPEEAEQEVHVVDLRAMVQVPHASDEESGERDWAGRWWVRGHIRRQPTKDGDKLIWVAPFIKGPEDKPFIEKVYRVVR